MLSSQRAIEREYSCRSLDDQRWLSEPLFTPIRGNKRCNVCFEDLYGERHRSCTLDKLQRPFLTSSQTLMAFVSQKTWPVSLGHSCENGSFAVSLVSIWLHHHSQQGEAMAHSTFHWQEQPGDSDIEPI